MKRKRAAKRAVKQASSRTSKKAARRTGRRSAGGDAKRSPKKSSKKAPKRSVKTAAKRSTKASARKAAKRSAKKSSSASPKRVVRSAPRGPARRAGGEAAAPARAALAPAQMVELVARYVSAFNRGDVESVLALYHPRATMEDPVGYTPARGHDAIGTVYQGGFRQGVTIVLDGAIRCAGGSVAFPVVARTPQATLQSVNVFDLAPDGRIERMRAYWGPYNVVGEIPVRG